MADRVAELRGALAVLQRGDSRPRMIYALERAYYAAFDALTDADHAALMESLVDLATGKATIPTGPNEGKPVGSTTRLRAMRFLEWVRKNAGVYLTTGAIGPVGELAEGSRVSALRARMQAALSDPSHPAHAAVKAALLEVPELAPGEPGDQG